MAKKKTPKATAPGDAPQLLTIKKPAVTLPGGDVPVFYVNHVNIDMTNWDVRFRMGLIQGLENDALQVKETTTIYMSHDHAKAFLKVLERTIGKLAQMPTADLNDGKAH